MAIDREPPYEDDAQLEVLRSDVYGFVESVERGEAALYQQVSTDQVEGFVRALGVVTGAGERGSLQSIVKYIADGPKREAELRSQIEAMTMTAEAQQGEDHFTRGHIVEVEVEPTPEPYVWRDTIVTMNGVFRDEIVAMIDEAAHALDPIEHAKLVMSLLALAPLVKSIPEYNAPSSKID